MFFSQTHVSCFCNDDSLKGTSSEDDIAMIVLVDVGLKRYGRGVQGPIVRVIVMTVLVDVGLKGYWRAVQRPIVRVIVMTALVDVVLKGYGR